MPKITKPTTPDEIIRAYGPDCMTGDQLEQFIDFLALAQTGTDNPEDDGEMIKLAKVYGAVAVGIETGVKDRHYEATIGVIGENRQVFNGVQFTTVAPSLPKTTVTEARYVPNAAFLMEQFPPHKYPDLWTLVPESSSTSKGRIGYVACEVL